MCVSLDVWWLLSSPPRVGPSAAAAAAAPAAAAAGKGPQSGKGFPDKFRFVYTKLYIFKMTEYRKGMCTAACCPTGQQHAADAEAYALSL